MKQTQSKNEHENTSAETSKSRWVPPKLSRLSAGNAETAVNTGVDGGPEFS